MADPERMMRATRRLTARETSEVTNPQTAEPTRLDLEKEDTFNKLADRVLSEERPASSGYGAKKEESVTVRATNVRDEISATACHVEDALAAMMTPGSDDKNGMAAMMQGMVDKAVSTIFESANFKTGLP